MTATKKKVSRTTEQLAEQILAYCRRVQGKLGSHCLEEDYKRALALVLLEQKWDFRAEAPVLVTYDGSVLATRKADFEVLGRQGSGLFLEVKAKGNISERDERQARSYASFGRHPICMLVNFGERPLLERIFVGTQQPIPRPARPRVRQVFYATHKVDAWRIYPPEKWPELGFNRHISSRHQPNPGDTLLIYRFPASDERAGICEVYRLEKIEHAFASHWLDRFAEPEPSRPPCFGYFMIDMTLVARLKNPITYSQMGTNAGVREWNRWRGRFRGNTNANGLVPPDIWIDLRGLIVAANPDAEPKLKELGV